MTRWTRPLYGPLQPGRLHRGPLPLMFGLWGLRVALDALRQASHKGLNISVLYPFRP